MIPELQHLWSLSPGDLVEVAHSLRAEIRHVVSNRGGHLAAPLGVVELAVALHHVFRSPHDRLVWDTGHQAYAHKLLSGRRDGFQLIRSRDGLSGFPDRAESEHDAFGTGHASTSIAAALGIATAMMSRDAWTIAVIGDAALAGGPGLEALNMVTTLPSRLMIVLNDNGYSISPNVGALHANRPLSYEQLAQSMGLAYTGPLDGHDVEELVAAFTKAKDGGARFIHVVTQKGHGDRRAEENPVAFHATAGPQAARGRSGTESPASPTRTLQAALLDWLVETATRDDRLVLVTPGMCDAAGLGSFRAEFPHRTYDMGIGEATAMTFAAGLAVGGARPIMHIYSTFLQRAVDQLLHDVGVQNLPLVLIIDRCGLCGADGPTHQGIFDLGFLSAAPNLTVHSVASEEAMMRILRSAHAKSKGPVAIRISKGPGVEYPRDAEDAHGRESRGIATILRRGADLTIVCHGRILGLVLKVADSMAENGIDAQVVDFVQLRPLDDDDLRSILPPSTPLLVVEEHVHSGSLGCLLGNWRSRERCSGGFMHRCIPTQVISHGTVDEQREVVGLTHRALVTAGMNLVQGSKEHRNTPDRTGNCR